MIHTVVFRLNTPIPLLRSLTERRISYTRLSTNPDGNKVPGTVFALTDYPFTLVAGRNRDSEAASLVFQIQLSLDDRCRNFLEFIEEIETVFHDRRGSDFARGQAELIAIEYHCDVPVSPTAAVNGAFYDNARLIQYGRETTANARQIVIGSNPSLVVYDRGRRAAKLRENRPHAYSNTERTSPWSRFEVRLKKDVQNGVQLLHPSLEGVTHPSQLSVHAQEICDRNYNPFIGVSYYETSGYQLPPVPIRTESMADAGYAHSLVTYANRITPLARIKGMLEVTNIQRVNSYCTRRGNRLSGPYGEILEQLSQPYNFRNMFLQQISQYFGFPIGPRRRRRPVTPIV